MKILMSALACEPGKGSELEVGFRALLAAAGLHEVWLLTNQDSLPAIRLGLEGRAEAGRIHLEGIDFGVDAKGMALLTTPGFHFYYDRWQRRAATRALELDHQVDFDVVHHATLAAYWTRTGVAVLDKPFVWGPVGGGVEPPLKLLPVLGWRGLLECVGRVLLRRVLGRLGPARRAQRRAVVTFAQNGATLDKIRTPGRLSVLTNATVVKVEQRPGDGTRTKEVFFIGRLLAWKGATLALRAFQYVSAPDARLVFCGEGPELSRVKRAARRWGLADRVRFEGWLPRDVLLSRLAKAGALLHPALHEEAGLCVAEALALGTPAVCLDHGGPSEILGQWPAAPSAAIEPSNRDITARRLAAAIDGFLRRPPPVPAAPRVSATSFEQELQSAYEVAGRLKSRVRGQTLGWAFPRGKPQLFTQSPRGLSKGVMVYAFGRRIPRLVQAGLAWQIRLPVLRGLLSERRLTAEPVCGSDTWQTISQMVRERHPTLSGEWLHFSSQWEKQRSSFVGLNRAGDPELFLTIEPQVSRSRSPLSPAASFRVPVCRNTFVHENWTIREFETLPTFHRPARWDPSRLRQVAADVSVVLAGRFERPRDTPLHWCPIHGDLVPWNLREDERGQLWLLDWEDAGWGPPLADSVRYIVAYRSLGRSSPVEMAREVRAVLRDQPADAIREAATFWLNHRNFRPAPSMQDWPHQKAKDAARWERERAALRDLAGRGDHQALTPSVA